MDVYSVVIALATDRRAIQVYLYEHTALVAEITELPSQGLAAFVVRTRMDGAEHIDTVRKLAQYQADRLCSGMYGCKVIGSYADALRHVADEVLWRP